jgi:hypothetical protein
MLPLKAKGSIALHRTTGQNVLLALKRIATVKGEPTAQVAPTFATFSASFIVKSAN